MKQDFNWNQEASPTYLVSNPRMISHDDENSLAQKNAWTSDLKIQKININPGMVTT